MPKKQRNIVHTINLFITYYIYIISYIDEKEQEFYRRQVGTSFGKMILAEFPTNPKYSIGKAKRKPLYIPNNNPGPQYSQEGSSDLKFKKPPKWKIGNALRPPLNTNERYDYYNYPYDESSDLGKLPKRWETVTGGATTLDPRIKYDFTEKVPGPGRYDPQYHAMSQRRKAPTYHLGQKLKGSAIGLETGTGVNVAPWTYKQDNVTSLSRHKAFPVYSFQKSKRKGLNERIWTKNESYFIYSSIGQQIMTQKPTRPIQSFEKAEKDKYSNRGIFKSMMERAPQKIRIAMPKF